VLSRSLTSRVGGRYVTAQEHNGPDQRHHESRADSGDERRDLEEIGEEECFALLESQDMGRLAIVRDGRPEIFPVNYALSDRTITIRSQPGVKLAHASLDWVAFEVEDIDRDTREGWVVEVRGFAQDITDAGDPWSEQSRNLGPRPWVTGAHEHFIAISHSQVSGRRLRRPTTS
jgi:uncharacterized protein